MRQYIFLAIGLGIGIAGTMLFLQSEPPEPESLEERAVKAELELDRAREQIAGFEAVMGKSRGRSGDTVSDRARQIAADIRAGRPVTIDDVFNTSKPWLRDLAPLFERMRFYDQKEHYDTIAGEYSRKYELTTDEEKALSEFLAVKAEQNAADYLNVLTSDQSTFRDFARASENFERDDDIDAFMEQTLEGEKLEEYRTERLNERLTQVQNEADRNVQRLDAIVGLDENQKDQMFVFMARSSRDFDPSMNFEGLTGDTGQIQPGRARNDAILEVLRPEQRAAFDEYQQQRREEAEDGMRRVGLTLPEDWDFFDEGGY